MESSFEELKRYVRFSAEDAALVAKLAPIAEPHLGRIARAFYDRIREHEDAHAVFTGEEQIQRQHASLVRWMKRLLSGKYDEAYFAESFKIGHAHVRVGLPQRYVFSAMALIRIELERLTDALGADAARTREALSRLIDIDLAVIVDSYRESLDRRVRLASKIATADLNRTLARTEHRYASAVELARVLIVGLDDDGRIRLFNAEAERVTGYQRDEVYGLSFVDTLVPEELHTRVASRFRQALEGPVSRSSEVFESVLRTRAGKLRDIRWQLAYAPSEDDVHDEVVLFAIGPDVTDELVARRRARQQEQLAAVGTLAAGLAHEIRNPLNGAQLHVSFLERALKKQHEGGEILEAVHVVGDEIKRLAALVTEFLDFARPKPLAIRRQSLQGVCHRVSELAAASVQGTKIALVCDMPSDELQLDMDAPKMQQVLLNLVQNAIEALGATGGGVVTVRGRRLPRAVTLEVEDDGPGLPSVDAPIFDAFFSTKPEGTGLGLAITQRIVSDHHGTIDVESRPGHTVFRVTLPLEQPGKQDKS